MKKNHLGLHIEKNALIDEGNGVLKVKGGLTLTDESVQHNGTRYDVKTLDIESDYDGKLFANHGDDWGGYKLETVIGKLVGVAKKGKRVIAEGIQYFTDNPLGLLAYNGTRQGFLTDYSIGTLGGEPDDEGVFRNHTLFEVSQVGIGNNRNAKLNELVTNSIKQAKENGMDTSELEKLLKTNNSDEDEVEEEEQVEDINNKETNDMKFVTVKNDRGFDIEVKYKNASDDEVTLTLVANASVDVSEDQKEAVESQIKNAVEPKEDTTKNELEELRQELNTFKEAFDASAKEPEFTLDSKNSSPTPKSVTSALKSMDYRELHQQQIENFRQYATSGNMSAMNKLTSINSYMLDRLKEEGIVRNAITIADMGNFVISPELITEMQGCRNSYAPVIDNTEWRETLSTQMAWLERSGDIDMQETAFCEDSDGSVGANDNLKPISEYGATPRTSNLSHVAAVTPICDAATRFLAVDILSDVAAGYRNDYDRKRAQLFVSRLEQAVDASSNSVSYDVSTPQDALISFLNVFGEVSTCTPTGTYVLSDKSLIELRKQIIQAGGSDVYNAVFFRGENGVPTIDGKPYLVVPSDLLPTLGTNETKTFVVDGANVTINHAVFYLDLSNFTGRISGGLDYRLATEASYEDNGTVKSAFQRDEVVLRGSFFRGGAVKDRAQVSGLLAPATS